MAQPEVEIPLTGGRVTVGIVRVGDTVRRPSNPSSEFMARFLEYLAARRCPWVPRYLGRDARARDILSFIEGDVPSNWGHFEDAQIRAAAVILRQLHDTTRGSPLAADRSVVVHNDPAPSNFVFQSGVPVALIDFDQLAPGEPLEDVGYMAWSWCVSSKLGREPPAGQAQQVRVLVDAYGLDSAGRRGLVDAMLEREARNIRFWTGQRDARAQTVVSEKEIEELLAWSRREIAYTSENRAVFEAALG